MRILVTGGAGFIGSHVAALLLAAGHDIVVIDNFSNSKATVLTAIETVARRAFTFYEGDIRDRYCLDRIFAEQPIDAVMHFAALKAVGESVADPLRYYDNNIGGTLTLLQAMQAAGVKKIVFSSSATVYGAPSELPLTENARLSAENPYGDTKLQCELLLTRLRTADPAWRIATLRYFNPVGAHPSGLLGEDPNGVPNNLMPFVVKVAQGKLPELQVFGNDYDTPDGTGVRDYIHIMDLAEGHIAALNRLVAEPGSFTVNLGTGGGYSVLDVIETFEAVTGQAVAHRFAPRRAGDIAACYADAACAEELLNWRATRGLADMCRDAWHFATKGTPPTAGA